MVEFRRRIILCFLTMTLLFSAAGCSAASAAAGQPQDETKAADKPGSDGNGDILGYLKAARSELELIDEIMADKDLGLLEEETDSEEELTTEQVDKYGDILSGYTDRIQTVLKDIDSRMVPDQPDIVNFQAAEKAAFQTVDSILQEFGQTLSYAGTMLMVTEEFAAMENIQETDLQAIYDAYSAAIGKAVTALEAEDVPSFFESFNKDFIDVLKELDDAVYYMLSAVAVDDPVKTDAAEYLMGILQRRAGELNEKGMQDLEGRVTKLSEDSHAIASKCDALKSWLDTNIKNLDIQ